MANLETQHIDEVIVSSRRKMLALGGAALAGLAFAGVKLAKAQSSPAYTDSDILNFALNLEYLESQFYTLATAGKTIDQIGIGIGAGAATTGGRHGSHQERRPNQLSCSIDTSCHSSVRHRNCAGGAQPRKLPAQCAQNRRCGPAKSRPLQQL